MDPYNLIYNGDFSEGFNGWSATNSGTSVTDGVLTGSGGFGSRSAFPLIQGDTYSLSLDFRINSPADTSVTSYNGYTYISIESQDSARNVINIIQVNKVWGSEAVLGADLANGDTTITLGTHTASIWEADTTYKNVGICNNIAWGYNRSTYRAGFTSVSDGVITLSGAWNGGSFPAGTKIAKFNPGGVYYYPITITKNQFTLDTWYHREMTFVCNETTPRRYAQFGRFIIAQGTTNPSMSYRNICIKNISQPQMIDYNLFTTSYFTEGETPLSNISIGKNGTVLSGMIKNQGMKVRYIKDHIEGSTANVANHWVELQAYDLYGLNVAFAKPVTFESSGVSIPVETNYVTDGSTASTPYSTSPSSKDGIIVDLGYERELRSIKVWHYWNDGRTYNNHTISVSTDGTNWTQIYAGTHVETSDGFEVFLPVKSVSPQKHGIITASDFIEY